MSILSFHQIYLKLADNVILDHVNWSIQPRDRIALVGRNGAGKSSLIKLLQDELQPDSGHIQKQQGLTLASLTQDVPISTDETVYHFLVKQLGPIGEILAQYHEAQQQNNLDLCTQCEEHINTAHAWELLPRIETMASHLDLPVNKKMTELSGGARRRVLLASALLVQADLLLLDEPTNHLDISAIEWLESYLNQYPGSVLVVTHDRQFLSRVANRILNIDRGQLHDFACDYPTYLDRREALLLAEQKENQLFDTRLKTEEAWIRQGIQARRTRNEGRVRRLKAMREAYKERRNVQKNIQTHSLETRHSGQLVLEAQHLCYHINQQPIVQDFSFLLTRGDKVGIIGPNGCGKTTLIRLLLGELKPDSGDIRHGTTLDIAYFDQLRRQLDEKLTVMNSVADGATHVTIQGQQKHVASYLRDFLFPPERFNQPVSSLSGGERNRLLLAKLLAKPVNLLVLDEPTNDLDIETLELLESMLLDYKGTMLLISHDRDFINHLVSSVLVYEKPGYFAEFVGGYDDYLAHKKQRPSPTTSPAPSTSSTNTPTTSASSTRAKKQQLSYHEKRELEQLPQQIEQLEQHIQTLHTDMENPTFYQQPSEDIVRFNTALAEQEQVLADYYARWEALENKK